MPPLSHFMDIFYTFRAMMAANILQSGHLRNPCRIGFKDSGKPQRMPFTLTGIHCNCALPQYSRKVKVPSCYLWLPAGVSSQTPTAAISVSSLWGAIQSFTTSCPQHRTKQGKMRFSEVSECGRRKTGVKSVDLPCKPPLLSCRVHVFWQLFPWAST